MLYILYALLGIALFAVVFTLVMGGRAMSRRDETSRQDSNKWMWRRVWAQGSALLLLAATLWYRRNFG